MSTVVQGGMALCFKAIDESFEPFEMALSKSIYTFTNLEFLAELKRSIEKFRRDLKDAHQTEFDEILFFREFNGGRRDGLPLQTDFMMPTLIQSGSVLSWMGKINHKTIAVDQEEEQEQASPPAPIEISVKRAIDLAHEAVSMYSPWYNAGESDCFEQCDSVICKSNSFSGRYLTLTEMVMRAVSVCKIKREIARICEHIIHKIQIFENLDDYVYRCCANYRKQMRERSDQGRGQGAGWYANYGQYLVKAITHVNEKFKDVECGTGDKERLALIDEQMGFYIEDWSTGHDFPDLRKHNPENTEVENLIQTTRTSTDRDDNSKLSELTQISNMKLKGKNDLLEQSIQYLEEQNRDLTSQLYQIKVQRWIIKENHEKEIADLNVLMNKAKPEAQARPASKQPRWSRKRLSSRKETGEKRAQNPISPATEIVSTTSSGRQRKIPGRYRHEA